MNPRLGKVPRSAFDTFRAVKHESSGWSSNRSLANDPSLSCGNSLPKFAEFTQSLSIVAADRRGFCALSRQPWLEIHLPFVRYIITKLPLVRDCPRFRAVLSQRQPSGDLTHPFVR